MTMSKLAIVGGSKTIEKADETLFRWPIVNQAMIDAQTKVLVDGNMSGTDIARKFEAEFAAWQGRKYALSHNNGTNALNAAMYGVGLGPGDEIICTSVTYWASCTGALGLGATVVFCDVNPDTLQMDPASLEAHITPRTKAIMVVHYMAYPAPMDEIMAIAKRHGLKFMTIADLIAYRRRRDRLVEKIEEGCRENRISIILQHEGGIVSVYKHNGKLLHKTGDRVSSGTPIALVGGSVEGDEHLRFELWYRGEVVDPAKYIVF